MKNARDVLKEVADGVTERTNEEDGVAVELRRLQSEGLLG
jgi:hydroxymethylpyrimidine pyrophosphatase-like HAD family hydrolase